MSYATCNLTPEQDQVFDAAYNAPAAVAYRQKLIFDALVFSDGEAANVMTISDILTEMEDGYDFRPGRFTGIKPTQDLRQSKRAQKTLAAERKWFHQTIGEELHKWIQDRDAASFHRLADLLEKMQEVSLNDPFLRCERFVERAYKSRPKFEIVVWRIFLIRRKMLRPDLAPNPASKLAGFDNEFYGVPTKAELREAVKKEWEKLNHIFDESGRTFRTALSKLGLSGLPSAPPIKKNITRGN